MDSDPTHHVDEFAMEAGARRRKPFPWVRCVFAALLLVIIITMAILQQYRGNREHSQDEAILAAGLRYNIHPALIKAVVWQESWFDPRARGTSGEIGLMQIRTPTAQDWAAAEKNKSFTPGQLFDPAKNTQCGAWYLRRLLNRYRHTDNPLAYALAAYNAGPTHVARWSKGEASTNSLVMLQQMDFPGTRKYVGNVIRRYEHYRRNFPPKNWVPNDRPPLIEHPRVQSRVSVFNRFSTS